MKNVRPHAMRHRDVDDLKSDSTSLEWRFFFCEQRAVSVQLIYIQVLAEGPHRENLVVHERGESLEALHATCAQRGVHLPVLRKGACQSSGDRPSLKVLQWLNKKGFDAQIKI